MDNVHFTSEEDKRNQIAELEDRFAGAKMHAELEEMLKRLAESSMMAKSIAGLKELDVKAPENQSFLQSTSQRVLQGILQSMPPHVRAGMTGVALKSVTWKPSEGVHFVWEIGVIGVAAIKIEHTISVDSRDIENTQ